MKARPNLALNGEKANVTEYLDSENFSEPLRAVNQNDLTVISIADYIADEKIGDEYLSYARKTGTGEDKTLRGYLNGLRKMYPVTCPNDLSDYQDVHGKNITDTQRKALGKFWGFVQTRKGKTSINGYPITLYQANLKIAEKGESKMSGRLKDLTAEEVSAARDRLPDDVQIYYSLLAYSGARHSHLYKALETPRTVERVGKVVRIDVHDLSSGTKNEAYFYFPAEMEKALKTYRHAYGYDYLQKAIATSGTDTRPVNVAGLRKWSYNMMLTGDVTINETAADHIQGRSPKSVGAAHYANLDKIASEGYNNLVPKFLDALPVPDWMHDGIMPASTKRVTAKPTKQTKSDPLDEKIKARYDKGIGKAEIMKELGLKKARMDTFLRHYPEYKSAVHVERAGGK